MLLSARHIILWGDITTRAGQLASVELVFQSTQNETHRLIIIYNNKLDLINDVPNVCTLVRVCARGCACAIVRACGCG